MPFYAEPAPFLQQGDLFRVDLVAPVADFDQRLFRSVDGKHGSAVLGEAEPAHVFDPAQLLQTLQAVERGPLHTDPFAEAPDGSLEYVIVQASLLGYFVIASQTCDISDQDRRANMTTAILPITPLRDLCIKAALPFVTDLQGAVTEMTIHDYVANNSGSDEFDSNQDASDYGAALRIILGEWDAPRRSAERKNVGLIKAFLANKTKGSHVYWLRDDPSFGVPDAFVDFSAIYAVPTAELRQLADLRIATLSDAYRNEFAQRFGLYLSRIATPVPMGPQPL